MATPPTPEGELARPTRVTPRGELRRPVSLADVEDIEPMPADLPEVPYGDEPE